MRKYLIQETSTLSSWKISEIFRPLSSEFTIKRILPPSFAPRAFSSNLRRRLALYRADISRLILLHREEPAVGAFAFARVDWQKDEHDGDGDTSRIVSAAATTAEGRCLRRRGRRHILNHTPLRRPLTASSLNLLIESRVPLRGVDQTGLRPF